MSDRYDADLVRLLAAIRSYSLLKTSSDLVHFTADNAAPLLRITLMYSASAERNNDRPP